MRLPLILSLMPLAFAGPILTVSPISDLSITELRDSFKEKHSSARHRAIDLMKPRGTPAVAVVGGTVIKLHSSKRGGTSIYLFDDAQVYCYYYAHLDSYADDLHEGQHVAPGDVLGYVGSTGNAKYTAPHLHFAIYKLWPQKHWWQGTAINPYPKLKQLLQAAD